MDVPSAKDYKKLSQREHVLLRCEMYVGEAVQSEREECLYYPEMQRMEKRVITIPRAVERLFLECLSNSTDNVDRSRKKGINPGVIHITMDSHNISIQNFGLGIPIEMHPTENMYVPELIFGNLLTGSNYDTSTTRSGVGQNGIGIKVLNIFSKHFEVDINDHIHKKHYIQQWKDNMSVVDKPKIESYTQKGSSVKVSYLLDFERFGYNPETGYPPETMNLFMRYACDFSMTCKIPIIFNGIEFNYSKIHDYAKLYFENIENSVTHIEHAPVEIIEKKKYEALPLVEMILIDTPDNGKIISFVNGMETFEHGIHVNTAFKIISPYILDIVNSSKLAKSSQLNMGDIKPHISMILSVRLPDPKYTSQTKTTLSSPAPKFNIDDKILKPISKWNLIERLYASLEAKQYKNLSKTDGKKKRHITGLRGEDANAAGTTKSQECTLYVVEGKSAMGYAVKAISLIPNGRDKFGILPLKGKPLNAMNATAQQIADNAEFIELKKMLGLRENVDYKDDENFATLRYGYLVILADSDDDGKHIIGLVLNLFHCRYPSLLERGYIMYLRTPILRVYQNRLCEKFYTYGEYLRWKEQHTDWQSWRHKYYKGLGTSKDADISDDFKAPRVVVSLYDDKAKAAFDLAFNDKLANERKKWIAEWQQVLDVEFIQQQPISEFINNEFIEFSIANLHRSIPRLLDGLKISQRKALWSAIKKWGSKTDESLLVKNPEEMKVARFAAFSAEQTNYHHGEKCLEETIVTMAQDFVGSNNLPYFTRDGQFGTRNMGGEDAAETRYSETRPEWWIPYVFKKHDLPLLDMIVDEGEEVEPFSFLPIIPMQLVNGSNGIGTGHSTFIPNHNPMDLIQWLKNRLTGNELPSILPWYRNFTGIIEVFDRNLVKEDTPAKKGRKKKVKVEALEGDDVDEIIETGQQIPKLCMLTKGKFKPEGKNKLVITELPIGKWTFKYSKWLETLLDTKEISDFRNLSTADTVKFEIKDFNASTADNLKLVKAFGLTNMVLLDNGNHPVKYHTIPDMLEAFYQLRLPYYQKRKEYFLNKYDQKIKTLAERILFIESVLSGKLKILGEKKDVILEKMKHLGLPKELLTSVNSSHYSIDEIQDLKTTTEKIKEERKLLEKRKIEEMWFHDLDEFEKEYTKVYKPI